MPEEDVGAKRDRTALLSHRLENAQWLPNKALRAHAGVLRHHESLWSRGFATWIALYLKSTALRQAPKHVVFFGLSLGGALAQMTAYRTVARLPAEMAQRVHVLTIGGVQWGNQAPPFP